MRSVCTPLIAHDVWVSGGDYSSDLSDMRWELCSRNKTCCSFLFFTSPVKKSTQRQKMVFGVCCSRYSGKRACISITQHHHYHHHHIIIAFYTSWNMLVLDSEPRIYIFMEQDFLHVVTHPNQHHHPSFILFLLSSMHQKICIYGIRWNATPFLHFPHLVHLTCPTY